MPFDNAAAPVNGGSLWRLASRAPDTPRSGLSPGLHGFCAIGTLSPLQPPSPSPSAVSPLSRLAMLRYGAAYPIDSLELTGAPTGMESSSTLEVDNEKE